MTLDVLFKAANALAMFAWILLAVAPHQKITNLLVKSGGVTALFSIAYILTLIFTRGSSEGGFGSLEAVTQLFSHREAVMAGWIHYLAFDLLIGCWEVEDSRKNGIRHWMILPALFLTFMLGPVGWFVYMLIRKFHTRKVVESLY